jgi:hypothetical protein
LPPADHDWIDLTVGLRGAEEQDDDLQNG